MGNEQSAVIHPLSRYCNELQGKLLQSRENGENNSEYKHQNLPRATKVDGRFILTPESFPDYVDYGNLRNLYKCKTQCEPHETYTDDYLNEKLPVSKPNQEVLARGRLQTRFCPLKSIYILCRSSTSNDSGHMAWPRLSFYSMGWMECPGGSYFQ
jgi:hypothetical protein